MIEAKDYDIVGSFNNQNVDSIDAERSINCFQFNDVRSKKKKNLKGTSGLDNSDLEFPGAEGAFRAEFVFGAFHYCVVGVGVYRVDVNGIVDVIVNNISNPLTTASGYVGIDANTFQILIVDGAKGYIYDTIADTFTMITDQSFPLPPVDCCYLDGFFVVVHGGTTNFQLSGFMQGLVWGASANNFTTAYTINNNLIIGASTLTGGLATSANYQTGVTVQLSVSAMGTLPAGLNASDIYYTIYVDATHIELATTYANAIAGIAIPITSNGSGTFTVTSLAALQLAQITAHPGTLVACDTLHRRLFLFSQNFTEVWENQGLGSNLPFRRNNSALIEFGTPCVGSISVSFDMMTFLSQSKAGLGSVMQIIGTQAIPISTVAINDKFSQFAQANQVADCRGFLIEENGLIFYRMNFTAANATFVYNVTMSDPSQDAGRLWHEEMMLDGSRHLAQTYTWFNGQNYVGSYKDATLYLLDRNTYTNDGEAIYRARISHPTVTEGYQRLRIDRLQFDLLQGQTSEIISAPIDFAMENNRLFLMESGNQFILEQDMGEAEEIMPTLFFSYSKDGGQTYGFQQRLPMGLIGERTFRTVVRKLGVVPRGQAFVSKIEFYDPIPFCLMGAAWVYEKLPE